MFHGRLADNRNARSVASQMRMRRFELFIEIVKALPGTINVLDVGGTEEYWVRLSGGSTVLGRLKVTLLNIQPQVISLPNFTSVVGDARVLTQFADKQFDIVHSNSTIEHVGSFSDQKKMADEVMRVGKYYYVQTPNRYFPIEPHFVFPFFQFLPIRARVWLVQHFKLGWYPVIPEYQMAIAEIEGIRLMTRSEVKQLFHNATIYEEKFLGLVKSFVAYTRP